MTDRPPLRIGIVGPGWRLAPYFTVMAALPGEFEPVAALARTEATADRVRAAHGIAATTSFDAFLGAGPFDAVLVSVPRDSALGMSGRLIDAGLPVLSETPLSASTDEIGPFLDRYGLDAPLQSAEQYRLQPMHAARIAVARSGRLGEVRQVLASVAHDYHAMSLVRAAMTIGFEPVEVRATAFEDLAVHPLGRDGWADPLEIAPAIRTVAELHWPDRGLHATYDFTGEQYFSPIRTRHLTLRGTHGELVDDVVRTIREPGAPVVLPLTRTVTGADGDLDGFFLRRIALGGDVLWSSTTGSARLADDELAVAAVLRGMAAFVRDDTPLYGIADAAEDHHLAELVAEAARTGDVVRSGERAWSGARSLLV